jgi:uncharacterized RDD family membrane protein YckC
VPDADAREPETGRRPGLVAAATIPALRVLQFAIDLVIVALLCLVPLAVTLALPRNPDGTLGALLVSVPVILAILLVCVVISWWWLALRPARHGGRTPAMRWLGLRVVEASGGRVSSGQMSARWLMLLVDGMFFGAVGLAAMLLTPRNQRLGDLVADTVVVRAGRDEGGQPWGQPRSQRSEPSEQPGSEPSEQPGAT